MSVDVDKCLSPEEEYVYLWEEYDDCGNFFAFEVHPNIVRADDIRRKRLLKRIKLLKEMFGFSYRSA